MTLSLRGPGEAWSVAALVRAVAETLAQRFPACAVQGELSGFSRAASGHCYFNLKDADGGDALIRCAMFRRAAGLLDFRPADGQTVELRGRLAVYEPRGELQFVVESMQRAGVGALYEQFLRLKARLEAEGLFDALHKRPLPVFPSCIGVVTSLAGAALHDVVSALARRAAHVSVIVFPSPVQGADAPAALVQALGLAGTHADVDTVILCRGGGSLEDLWAFNDERVVRAVAACPKPIVVGVGHETDISLADFAADVRAPTPTAAAELAAPATQEALQHLMRQAALLRRGVERLLDLQAQRLDRAALRLARPGDVTRREGQRLWTLAHRSMSAVQRQLSQAGTRLEAQVQALQRSAPAALGPRRHRLDLLAQRLSSVDPSQVLGRGYAWLSDRDGRPVQSTAGLSPGQHLTAVLADGRAAMDVVRVMPDEDPARR